MNTVERLNSYYDFSPAVVERVAEVADVQRSFEDFRDYFNHLGVKPPTLFKGHSILDIKPTNPYYDDDIARVYHYPMGNANDANMVYQAATLFAADPSVRLIGVGNASWPGFPGGGLNPMERWKVTKKNDLRPVVDPVLDYLKQEGITSTEHVGESYGATKAVVAAANSERYDQLVTASVLIEPADVKARSLPELASDFKSSEAPLDGYQKANQLPAFDEARKHAVGKLAYIAGLARPTNIAISRYLTKGLFETNLTQALSSQPEMVANVIWGSESELAIDWLVSSIVRRAKNRFTYGRANGIRLPGQRHALADDLHLKDALVLETLGLAV